MRKDMAKVIDERPRGDSGWERIPKARNRSARRMGGELPKREGIKRRHNGGTKYPNSNLAPLRRFIEAHVGRPWDKVFSEMCEHIGRSNPIREYLQQFVETDVRLVDGVPQPAPDKARYGWHRKGRSRIRQPFYVCPKSGLLRRVKRIDKPKRELRLDIPKYVRVSRFRVCKLIDGCWHLVTLEKRPEGVDVMRCKKRDVIFDINVATMSAGMLRREYGANAYAVSYRRMSKRDLAQSPVPADLWDPYA